MDLQLENKLTTKYDKLKASAQIEFDGKVFAIIEDRLIKTRFINSKDLQTNE